MQSIPFELIQAYRADTFRLHPHQRLRNPEEALDYAQERGFLYFWPISRVTLPSLWVATAGDRPVAEAHDDPGHVTWGWKDALLGQRRWYYAKVLRKKATIIALDIVPYFYALSENYGAPEEDYLTLYEQGRLTQEARAVYETLLTEGPLDTVSLRRAARLSSPESEGRFNRALTDLQTDFKILPVGIADAGAWHYAFVYDTVHHHYPDLPVRAHAIPESAGRQKLAGLYLLAVGAAQVRQLATLFGWSAPTVERVVQALSAAGLVRRDIYPEGHSGDWIVLSRLV